MRFVIISSCFIVTAMSSAMTHLDYEWKEWKIKYEKTYPNEYEAATRRKIWEKNLELVDEHNAEARKGKDSFTIEMNHFGDKTPEELSEMLASKNMNRTYHPTPHDSSGWQDYVGAFPPSIDWRTYGCVTRVKNQRMCNACWAFSVTGALEALHCQHTGIPVSLSEQNLIDCVRKNGGCSGGWPENAYNYIIENGGVDTESSYQFQETDGNVCRFRPKDIGAKMTNFYWTMKGDESSLMAAVVNHGPVSVCIDANDYYFQIYKEGVYDNPQCNGPPTHCLLVVGYGNYKGKDYWLVKNSWGEEWGMDGYGMMSRNKNSQCGIADHATYPVLD